MTYFWNFGTPSISRERIELETSNLTSRLTIGGTNDKNEKLGQRGSGRGQSRDLLLEFWDPLHISGTFELKTSNLACRLTTGCTNDKNEKLGQGGRERVT